MGKKRRLPASPSNSKQPTPHKMTKLQEQMKSKIDGAQFRYLNEQLYTTTGNAAFSMFQKDPELFDVYHRGFTAQVEKWPENPIDGFIDMLKGVKSPLCVADMGCGEAALAQALVGSKHTIHSFDLVARNKYIVACDIAKTPLKDGEADVVIFSLSLMGTDVLSFLLEARRILRKGGILKIAEVKSRFEGDCLENFLATLKMIGFQLLPPYPTSVSKDQGTNGGAGTGGSKVDNKMFFLMTLKKRKEVGPGKWGKLPAFTLKPCVYKRR